MARGGKGVKRKRLKILSCFLITIMFLGLAAYNGANNIPNTIFVRQGQNIGNFTFMHFDKINKPTTSKNNKINVSLLGIVPIKSVNVESVPEIKLYPGGQPVGIKLSTKGVLIVGFSDINTLSGKKSSPAAMAGVQIGDTLLKIDNKYVEDSKDLGNKINASKDKKIKLTLERNGKTFVKEVDKVKSDDDESYKIGLWVRDSTAGVGTMTFYYDKDKKFGALGHPITDVDTGSILKINNGNLINSSIVSVRKGIKGTPGEIRGIFVNEDNPIGSVEKNTICGIFGKSQNALLNRSFNKPLKVALRNEIRTGEAKILTTVDGDEPSLYSVNIEKLFTQNEPGPKSMIIRVTDKELLKKTGGIVQGMSGSPIIQDGKIVGAVTHVLINRPDVGYGIYIEWMLKSADIF